jgi:SAM-dependent methyltransferase
VSDVYWTNVCDPELPFGGVIEHTNLLPASDYGCHVIYVSRYFTHDEPIADADPAEEAERWVKLLDDRWPGFSADDVLAVHPFRTPYAAPLVKVGHLARIPPVRSHLSGLYASTTAQIYPQDRGMSEGVRTGGEAAALIADDLGLRAGGWACPVCGGVSARPRWDVPAGGTEGGVDAEAFRPSAEAFGHTAGSVVECTACGHGSLADPPPPASVSEAYADAADPVSLREEPGQVETARRALADIERIVRPGRMVDLGCWTGSFLVAARERGWDVVGVEPSRWASDRARERGLDVRTAELDDERLPTGEFRLVVLCDVLEHLERPGDALDRIHDLLEPGGALYLTVPDAGSRLARTMGRRWWSVLPMHIQYFTRSSLARLLGSHGFRVADESTHAKVFSARYYAERLGGYAPWLERLAVGAVEKAGQADRPVAPDFRDRLAVLAVREDVA